MPEQHVPNVLVAGAYEANGADGQNVRQEIAEAAFPSLRAMLFAELVQ
jgi:hypothetical protein